MKHREMLLGAGAAVMAAAAQTAFATQDPSQHMHGGGKYAALAAAAGNCVIFASHLLHFLFTTT